MRCPDCNKFVSNEDGEPEPESPEINGHQVDLDVRRVILCAECGTDLKEVMLSLSMDIISPDDAVPEEGKSECAEHEWKMDGEPDVENMDRSEGQGRGRKQFYGVTVNGNVICPICGMKGQYDGADDVQSSHMDDLT